MKMIVSQEESGFSLKDLTVNDKKIDKEKEYSIFLTDTTMSVLKKINPKCEIGEKQGFRKNPGLELIE